MKTLRNVRTILVALCGATMTMVSATSLSAGSTVPNIPDMDDANGNPVPVKNYELVSTLVMKSSMGKKMSGAITPVRVTNMTWECWIEHKEVNHVMVPLFRTTAWLIGGFKDQKDNFALWPNDWVDLHEVGAQHRDAIVFLRVTTTKSGASVSLQKVEDRYKPVSQADLKEEDRLDATSHYGKRFAGFYRLLPSRPVATTAGTTFDSRYVLKSDDPTTIIEVCYQAHKPGENAAQYEDGGPPSNPPTNEN